eukprot:9109640-Lingulodinium_polyedra.AAC.1
MMRAVEARHNPTVGYLQHARARARASARRSCIPVPRACVRSGGSSVVRVWGVLVCVRRYLHGDPKAVRQ